MKRLLYYIGIVAFFAILIVPSVIWFGFTDKSSISTNENRKLADFPDLSQESFETIFSSLDEWYNDNIPFKDDAVNLKNQVTALLFNEVDSRISLLGTNGYIFYKRVDDGNPLADYKGTLRLTDEQNEAFLSGLLDAEDNLARQGIEFYVIAAPNKEIVYERYMPQVIKRVSDETQTAQLAQYLSDNGISCFKYLLEEESEEDYPTYYQLDTHWNQYGGYLGYRAFLDMMDNPPQTQNYEWQPVDEFGGDLATALSLGKEAYESNYLEAVGHSNELVYSPSEEIEYFKSTKTNPDPRKVLIISDSFRYNFKQYPADDFAEVVVLHRSAFDPSVIQQLEYEPDIVVLVFPERYTYGYLSVLTALSSMQF